MKLLVFAHTPPPHHGQSYMVQLMLEGFGGDCRGGKQRLAGPAAKDHGIECYHVNARLSRQLQDIGDLRIGKFFLLVGYCLQALWLRFRYGVDNLYYVPAPGKKSALYRDWLVMAMCRPFFKRIILHWHASGLAKWLETSVQFRTRSITYNMMKQADLSIVLSKYGRSDAEKLFPARIAIVVNGIPDPCPDFEGAHWPRRRARVEVRRLLQAGSAVPEDLRQRAGGDPEVFKVLFLGHCTGDKGLFDALLGAIRAHEMLVARRSAVSLHMVVAGSFLHPEEEKRFQQLCAGRGRGVITYVGFVGGDKKRRLFEQSDVFCFPSHLESFGLVVVEAMAFGLPVVTTRCGALPEVVPANYTGLVDARSPEQVAGALLRAIDESSFGELRQHFQEHFTVDRHILNLAAAVRSVGQEPPRSEPVRLQIPSAELRR